MSLSKRNVGIGYLLLACVCAEARTEPQELPLIAVKPFAELPADVRHPEGLAVDPDSGEVYVGTFDAREPAEQRNNQVLRLSATGQLLARKSFGATPLTGLLFAEGQLYILNFGAASLQRLPAAFNEQSDIETLVTFAALPPPSPRKVSNPDGSKDRIEFASSGMPAPNGMVFDRAGNLYVSDSFQGAVLRIPDAMHCAPCKIEMLARDPLFTTTSFLPFGANGLAFNADETLLYINNAGDGRVLRMPMPGGPVEVFAESVPGADGLLFHAGRLWVVTNQADRVVALNSHGLPVLIAGAFLGLADNGAPRGLLFPASTAVQGQRMLVTNLALPLTQASGDEWEERATRWNLMQFDLPSPLTGE